MRCRPQRSLDVDVKFRGYFSVTLLCLHSEEHAGLEELEHWSGAYALKAWRDEGKGDLVLRD